MLLTPPQIKRFWREWAACIRLHKWTKEQSEVERKTMLARAGFTSLTEVDKLDGFDRVLAEIKALSQPSDLDAQLRQENMPRTRLIYSCLQKADEPYIIALARDRFHTAEWRNLGRESLEQLRNTLADRQVAQHRTATQNHRRNTNRQRRTSPNPDARITFPDLPPSAICHLPSAMPETEPEYATENAPF